jgi:hypothetical protein
MIWNQAIDSLLDKIRLNAVQLTNKHINNHLYYKNCSKYFEIPVIILSVFSGSWAVGSGPYLHQESISVVSCSISMVITILTSIKLFMKITENAAQEQELAKEFKTLALEIFKTLSLPDELRGIDGIVFLNKIYSKYIHLVETSEILNRMNKKDNLLVIDPKMLCSANSSVEGSSPKHNPLSLSTNFSFNEQKETL